MKLMQGCRWGSRRSTGGLALLAALLHVAALAAAQPQPLFVEVPASSSGIDWVHENAMSSTHYLPETMGAGAAFLDYDGDGWMDIYLVNSGPSDFFKPTSALRNALYRNNKDGTFSDVTQKAGVEGGTFGMGVAVGDLDNDGAPDMLVTSYGKPVLYHNRGDGSFADITNRSGLDVGGWMTSAAWFDYDGDGLLDLFICRYVEFSKEKHISCGLNPLGKSYYCVPRVFAPTRNLLFRNNGDRTFTHIKGNAIHQALGKALGVVATDVNNDGRMDLFVANDTVGDFLFLNRGQGRWEEAGIFAGVGFSVSGQAQSGMGVDSADFDGDGWQDLFVSNIDHQDYELFKNNGDESFDNLSIGQGISQSTFLLSGWGLKFFDFDNDGDMDLLVANGHPDDMISEYSPNVSYKEPLLLFENRGGRFQDISKSAGEVFSRSLSARGLAIGDFDNDGYQDVLVSNNGEAPLLLRNTARQGHHWLGIRLQGKKSNRQGIGARISWSAGKVQRSMLVTSGGSYLSSHDPRLVLGLGQASAVDWVDIQWPEPDRLTERFTQLPVDQYVTIQQGLGTVPKDE